MSSTYCKLTIPKTPSNCRKKIKPGTAWNEDPVLGGGPILLGALQQLFMPRDLDLGHQADQLCLGLGERMLLQIVLRICGSGRSTHPDFFHSPACRWGHQEAQLRLDKRQGTSLTPLSQVSKGMSEGQHAGVLFCLGSKYPRKRF